IRWLSALHDTEWGPLTAVRSFTARWPRDPNREIIERVAVAPGTTSDPSWSPIAAVQPLQDGFLAIARPEALIGRIKGLRKVPFKKSLTGQQAQGFSSWGGQGKAKAVTKLDFSATVPSPTKPAGIIVLTKELLMLASPGSEALLESELTAGIAKFLDQQ